MKISKKDQKDIEIAESDAQAILDTMRGRDMGVLRALTVMPILLNHILITKQKGKLGNLDEAKGTLYKMADVTIEMLKCHGWL